MTRDEVFAVEDARRLVITSWPGIGRKALINAMLARATELAEERDRLAVKLETQWTWLMAQCPDDRTCLPDEQFGRREQTYATTLKAYLRVCDELSKTAKVLF